MSSDLVIEVGNKFIVIVVVVNIYVNIWVFYKKVVSVLDCVRVDYNIFVYWFWDKFGLIYEDY